MDDFGEVEYVRTVRARPFEMVLRWNFDPLRAITIKDSISRFPSALVWEFYRLGLACSFLRTLRTDYPFALLLTNDETMVSDSAANRRVIPWSFAWDSGSVESYEGNEGPSVLLDLKRGTVGYHLEGLLGLYPYPASYVLLLSRQEQNVNEVETCLKSLSPGDDLTRALLEVVDVLWLSGEAEYLSIATGDPSLASRLGFTERQGEGT